MLRPFIALFVLSFALSPLVVHAQDLHATMLASDGHGPSIFAADSSGVTSRDARNSLPMRRRVSLDLTNVPIAVALAEVARQAGLKFTYTEADIPNTIAVTLQSRSITVAAALTEILLDTKVDIVVLNDSQVALSPHDAPHSAANKARPADSTGAIAGRVIDAHTGAQIADVLVSVEGTGIGTRSGPHGQYALKGIRAGRVTVVFRLVGYTSLSHIVDVIADSTSHVDIALAPSIARLDEIVTTAVGDQRRFEVGNAISTIAADSIVPTAPITSLTDLITARAPGVQVMENGGMVGSGEAIRIRGENSLVLQGDPILIIDGVRQDNSAGGTVSLLTGDYEQSPSRLNDIDFSSIERIDVLKGPSASTEYGTDAANGVIVVTTKRGNAGKTRWDASAEQGIDELPVSFPTFYYSWGHTTDGTDTPVQCPFVSTFSTQYGSASKTCAVDSVTAWDPLNHASTSIFGEGARQKYNLSASGGTNSLRYFVGGTLTDETGIARIPQVFRPEAEAAEYPASAMKPNSQDQKSLRANSTLALSDDADLSVAAAYLSTDQVMPSSPHFNQSITESPVIDDSAHFYGYGATSPIASFGQIQSQTVDRVTGGLTANWHPLHWLTAHATVGVDHGSLRQQEVELPQAQPQPNQGSFSLIDGTNDIYSTDLRASATAHPTSSVGLITSVGFQDADTRTQWLGGTASGLSNVNVSLNGVANPSLQQTGLRQATLGGYGEEQISLWDRLFLTGALRADGASGFGKDYSIAAYPKASMSFVALDARNTTVRLRGAFGESGRQPYPGSANQLYYPHVEWVNGQATSVLELSAPGNPNLRPERSIEYEGGTDLAFWHGRVNVEFTGYYKATRDALIDLSTGWTVNSPTIEENLGAINNQGFETLVSGTVVDARTVRLDLTFNGSINHNKVESLAPGMTTYLASNGNTRSTPGYCLYCFWAPRVTYTDVNHDGIIEPNEVTMDTTTYFIGSAVPTLRASTSAHLSLDRGVVSINSLFDYGGGFYVFNENAYYEAQAGSLSQQNLRGESLALQAQAVAANLGSSLAPNGFFENGEFVRFRELSVTIALPQSWAHSIRFSNMSITGAVRNLALWTRYGGPDPEVSNAQGGNLIYHVSTSPTPNNDVRQDAGTVPLARYWITRINLSL